MLSQLPHGTTEEPLGRKPGTRLGLLAKLSVAGGEFPVAGRPCLPVPAMAASAGSGSLSSPTGVTVLVPLPCSAVQTLHPGLPCSIAGAGWQMGYILGGRDILQAPMLYRARE